MAAPPHATQSQGRLRIIRGGAAVVHRVVAASAVHRCGWGPGTDSPGQGSSEKGAEQMQMRLLGSRNVVPDF